MSDNFIPLNQSTPVRQRWQGNQGGRNQQRGHNNSYFNNRNHSSPRHNYNNRWGNNSQRNSSYGSDSSSSFNKSNIDAYLHASMLQDPWAQLRRKLNATS